MRPNTKQGLEGACKEVRAKKKKKKRERSRKQRWREEERHTMV